MKPFLVFTSAYFLTSALLALSEVKRFPEFKRVVLAQAFVGFIAAVLSFTLE